jgi:hypothetical protein
VRDVFISHASEDKDAITRPLAEELQARGCSVWFDEFELVLGDSLRQKIDQGLAGSSVGVVILSHAFFAKRWPQHELNGLTARLMSGEDNVIIPIWHELEVADLLEHSPPLADLLAGSSADGPAALAAEIERVLHRRAEASGGDPLAGSPPPTVPAASSPGAGEPTGSAPVLASPPRSALGDSAEPREIHDATLELLQAGQDIPLDQLMRSERHRFEAAIDSVTADHIQHHLDEATLHDAAPRLDSATDRRLASLVPLVLYRPDRLAAELRGHASWATGVQLRSGGMTWQEAWRLPFWVLGMTLGALGMRLERHAAIEAILAASWTDHYGDAQPFVGAFLGEPSETIANTFGPPPERKGEKWISPCWEWLAAGICAKAWLVDRYPDWLERDGEPKVALTEFDVVSCVARGLGGEERPIAHWTIYNQNAEAFARRLHRDPRLRAQIADAVHISVAEFEQRAPEILASVYGLGNFPRPRDLAEILTGAR